MSSVQISQSDEILIAEISQVFHLAHDSPSQEDILLLCQRVRDTQEKNLVQLVEENRRLREGSAETATVKFLDGLLTKSYHYIAELQSANQWLWQELLKVQERNASG